MSKLLLERMGPTMLADLLYLGAGVGLLCLRVAARGRFAALAFMAIGTVLVTRDAAKGQ